MERNRHILVYNREIFTLEKLEQSVAFLKDATGFTPDMVIMDGTPRFENTEEWEIEGVRKLAADWEAEVWTSGNTHREGQEIDERGVPVEVARFDERSGVIVNLVTESDHIKVQDRQGARQHRRSPRSASKLDPTTMLLRWR